MRCPYKLGAEVNEWENRGFVSKEFAVKPIFEQFGNCGAVNGDSGPLEPFWVVDDRNVRICEIPEGSVVNNIFQKEGRVTYVSFQIPKCFPPMARVVHS